MQRKTLKLKLTSRLFLHKNIYIIYKFKGYYCKKAHKKFEVKFMCIVLK